MSSQKKDKSLFTIPINDLVSVEIVSGAYYKDCKGTYCVLIHCPDQNVKLALRPETFKAIQNNVKLELLDTLFTGDQRVNSQNEPSD